MEAHTRASEVGAAGTQDIAVRASLEQEGEGNENTLLHEETLDVGQITAREVGWGWAREQAGF